MILLTGATGSVGYELAKLLSSRGISANAMVRSTEAAQKLAHLAGIVPVMGDFNDPVSLSGALAGATRAFLLTNSSEEAEGQQLAFVQAAKEAGVEHIVKLSQLHADIGSPVRFLRYHANVEQAIRGSGMSFTFLRPNLFMQALLAFKDTIAQSGKFFAPIGDARVSLVDIRDIAEIAAQALVGSGHQGRVYDITGPQALTHAEIALQIGNAMGRPVSFIDVPPEAMRQAVLDVGFPLWQADGLIEDYAHYARGEAEGVSSHFNEVTSQPARSFAEFVADYGYLLKQSA
jgi:uncharacterized protein YbjT (DUF2867 family)